MLSNTNPARTLAIFCRVVDNYGDIGICWRLARQLQREHGLAVTLWVDDLASFRRICPPVLLDARLQQVEGVSVQHWQGGEGGFTPADVADIVIEFFGVELPATYIEAMARRSVPPVWLNLEGLSAEAWVEGCHRLPSMHPRLPLTKHFFFPGFTDQTGGLLREAALGMERDAFQTDAQAVSSFLSQLGLNAQEIAGRKVSLFCYPEAPVAALFNAWEHGAEPLTCLVPEGVAAEAVAHFVGGPAHAGARASRGALSVRVIPFVAQPDYDRLLWSCDLNFVRGEDSFVRAQWSGKPFIWHIYLQDENLHHVKLRAFLQRYAPAQPALQALTLRWNGTAHNPVDASASWPELWSHLVAALPGLTHGSEAWEQRMLALGDLATNLLTFAGSIQAGARQN